MLVDKTCNNCLLKNLNRSVLCLKYQDSKLKLINSNINTKEKLNILLNFTCPYWMSDNKIKNKPTSDLDKIDVKIEINKLVAHYN